MYFFFSCYRNIRHAARYNPESLQDLSFKILRASTIPSFFLKHDTPEKFTFQDIILLMRFSATLENLIDSGDYPKTGYLTLNKKIDHWYSGCFREIIISFVVHRRGKHFLKNVALDLETSPKGVLESELFSYCIKKTNM